jgi:hypothetical protein
MLRLHGCVYRHQYGVFLGKKGGGKHNAPSLMVMFLITLLSILGEKCRRNNLKRGILRRMQPFGGGIRE